MVSIAVVGSRGYVGRALVNALRLRADVDVTPVSREQYDAASTAHYDVVVNAAMPSARFKARNEPLWDFDATVGVTAQLRYRWSYGKLVQISSVSARCQLDTVYGRHKELAERLCGSDDLIVRLAPLYSEDLAKGVLADMANGRPVWADGASRYAFVSRDWAADWLAANLLARTGMVEIGGRDAIALGEVADRLGLATEFRGDLDHQEITEPEPGFPTAAEVLPFMRAWLDRPAATAR